MSEFTSIFRYFLLAFGAIALFVGAFVIFNTFSITVAQRTREFATLRTIGASRRQILGSVILESLVIGLFASLVGLGLGVLLAEGIEALFGSLGVDLPSADRVFATRTIVVSLIVGIGITLAAGLFPAIRATRVPPISAVREGATLPTADSIASHHGSRGSSWSSRSYFWPARCSPTSSAPASGCCRSPAGSCFSSSASRCSRRTSSSRSRRSWERRRVGREALPAGSRAATPSATPAGRLRPPPR